MIDINILPFKNYLSNNWKIIEEKISSFCQIKESQDVIFVFDNYNFEIYRAISEEQIIITRQEKGNSTSKFISLPISIFSRAMDFEKDGKINTEIIFDKDDISRFIEEYKLEYPLYYDSDSKKEKSVLSDKLDIILRNKKISKIYDDNFINEISKNTFYNVIQKYNKIENYYINRPNDDFSNDILEGKILQSEKRTNLVKIIQNFNSIKGKEILFLAGGKKTGKTISILGALFISPILYFNIKEIKSKIRANDIKKILFKECMHLFLYSNYDNFYNFYQTLKSIKGYNDNIWNLINNYCKKIIEHKKISNPIIVIDNYDDIYIKKSNEILSREIINQKLLINKNIKFIICGNGKFINDLIYKKILSLSIDSNYEIIYNNDLDLKIDNKPFIEYFLEQNKTNYEKLNSEFKDYFIRKYKNEEIILSQLIIFEEYVVSKQNFRDNHPFLQDFPIQFFKIIFKEGNLCFNLDYLYKKLFEFSNNLIKYYILKGVMIALDMKEVQNILHKSVQGYLLERYVISMFEFNKIIVDLEIPSENIIKIEEICKINEDNVQVNNLINNSKPILIKQSKEGAYYDFAIILEKNNLLYALLIKVGLNKKKCEISKVFIASLLQSEILIKALSKLIGKKISKLSLMYIFSKEKQEFLINLRNDLIEKLKNSNNENEIKKEISKIYLGKNFTQEFYIPYLEFSHNSNSLFLNGKKISSKEQFLDSFYPITNSEFEIENNENLDFSKLFPNFDKQFKQFLNEEDIKQFKIINEITADYDIIIQNLGMMLFVLFILKNNDYLIAYKSQPKNIKYIKYDGKNFKHLNKKEFKKLINEHKNIYLCKKIYIDPIEQSVTEYINNNKINRKRNKRSYRK